MNAAIPVHSFPQVIGDPGLSLRQDPSFAVSETAADLGERAERSVGGMLSSLAHESYGPTVIHDVTVTAVNGRTYGNIDHVLVSGRHVLFVDTKAWKPGVYWTLGGVSRRGLHRPRNAAGIITGHLDKTGMVTACDIYTKHFSRLSRPCHLRRPVLAVSSTSPTRAARVGLYRPKGATAVSLARLERLVRRTMFHGPGNADVVALFNAHCTSPYRGR